MQRQRDRTYHAADRPHGLAWPSPRYRLVGNTQEEGCRTPSPRVKPPSAHPLHSRATCRERQGERVGGRREACVPPPPDAGQARAAASVASGDQHRTIGRTSAAPCCRAGPSIPVPYATVRPADRGIDATCRPIGRVGRDVAGAQRAGQRRARLRERCHHTRAEGREVHAPRRAARQTRLPRGEGWLWIERVGGPTSVVRASSGWRSEEKGHGGP